MAKKHEIVPDIPQLAVLIRTHVDGFLGKTPIVANAAAGGRGEGGASKYFSKNAVSAAYVVVGLPIAVVLQRHAGRNRG